MRHGLFSVCAGSGVRSVTAVTTLAVLALAGCTHGPVEMSDMTAALGEELSVQASAERPVSGPVSVAGGLRPALLASVQGSALYRAVLAREQEALTEIGVAAGARRPQVSTSATAGGVREDTPGEPTTTGVAAGITLSQLVYDGGASVATVNRATALALAAQAERRAQGNDIALEAGRAWIDVWQFDQRLRLLQARTADMNTVMTQIERMASQGMIDRAALDSAQRQIVDISLEEFQLEAALREAQVRFDYHFNIPGARVDRPDQVVTLEQATAAAADWREAPRLQQAAAEVFIARNAVTIAQAAFGPRARLQAGIASPMDDADSTDTSVGLTLEYSIGDGGRRRASLQSAQAGLEAAEAQLADAQRMTQAELDAALARLSAIRRSMPLLRENIRLSASEAETARSQIVTGQSNLRQLIEAEIENYRASDEQIAMQAEKQLLQLVIAARTGALGEVIGLDGPAAE